MSKKPTPKRGPGRPRVHPEDERRLMVRYNPAERRRWDALAKELGGVDLAVLARGLINKEARRVLGE